MQLRVTVHRLNKRRFIPWQIPEPTGIAGQVIEGFTFEGVAVSLAEIPNPAIGSWYRDRDGYYYWGGGVMEILQVKHLISNNYYFEKIGITSIWQDLKFENLGSKIKVAILDTGLDPSTSELMNIKDQKRFFCNESTKQCFQEDGALDSDENFHGTRCASVIGAKHLGGYYTGVAPDCDMYIYRIKDDFFFNPSKLQIPFALQYILDKHKDIDIISMSFQFSQTVTGLEDIINKCKNAGILVFAAVGNTLDPNQQFQINFPGCYDNCIEIGACDEDMSRIIPSSCYNEKLIFLSPGINVPVLTGMQQKATENNTSIATAFTAGVAALLLSYVREKGISKIDAARIVIKELKETGIPYVINIPNNTSITTKIIQPYSAFNNLKLRL